MATTHLLVSFLCLFLPAISLAHVPATQTCKYVNKGEFGPYITEYDASYRTLPIAASPFQFCFYNTTPSAFFLALRMGATRSEHVRRWVWETNRGHPVGENATLTFSRDGNLVLADAGGKVAWQTGTANKGVVGLRLLASYCSSTSRGSFDQPTDTLLVGQSLLISSGRTGSSPWHRWPTPPTAGTVSSWSPRGWPCAWKSPATDASPTKTTPTASWAQPG